MRNWCRRISIFLGVFVACSLQASVLIGAPLGEIVGREIEQSIERKLHPRTVPHSEPLERPSGYIEARPGEDIILPDISGKVQTEDQAQTQRDFQRATHKCTEHYLNKSDRENCEQE